MNSQLGNRVVRTEDLFGDLREIWIEHDGERYRLRITRRNKLILQK
ncbi:MAG: hemin uptake protein HemP [Gemmataceae bacterium]